jgi:CheY-like chemotaxis protein
MPGNGQRNILIVEDSPGVARSLASLLKKAGYQAEICLRGQEALDRVQQKPAPDAALVDIHLPDISGLVLSQQLRERLGPGAPIIIVSGDTSMENLNSLPQVGATYFFSKPLKSSLLLERLEELLNAPSQ